MNKTADFFMCLAFDNRIDLNPLHIWLLPSYKVKHLKGTGISITTIDKWDKYRLSTDKIISCCDILRGSDSDS